MKEEIEEDLYLTFVPNEDQILGVVGDMIHVKNEENILIIPREEYFRIWNKWLDRKNGIVKIVVIIVVFLVEHIH